MNESAAYEGYKKKLEGICDKNNLTYTLSVGGYPITLTIRPVQGMEEQMTMLAMADEEPYNDSDATIVLVIEDGALSYKMSKRFTINKTTFDKITNLFKKLHFCYLQMFHRNVTEKGLLRVPYTPTPPDESNEPITETLEGYESEEEQPAETPDFPDDLMDEDPADSDVMSIDEYLLKRATEYVRQEGHVNLNMLCSEFNISYSKAGTLIEALTDAGVISQQTGLGGMREVLPYEEDADNE